jgi:bifunctional enzyme CysN/CysC
MLENPTFAAALLAKHGERELLRLAVVGSVDDGKSTLIGRLLYDSSALPDDQIAAAKLRGGGAIDFSLFTDGLLAEREQGITIDVAYRYLSTQRRQIIVADTPGHVQYTRNMATGASTADAAIILVDARQGVQQQTRRHAYIAGLLGIPYLAVAINKMDLVEFNRQRYESLANEVLSLTSGLGFEATRCFAISATEGDGVTRNGSNMPWQDTTLMSWLESLPHQKRADLAPLRFVVQQVLRPNIDQRFLSGRVVSGAVQPGDNVTIYPSGKSATVARITTMSGDLAIARAPLSVALELTEDIDAGRGDVVASPQSAPEVGRSFDASIVWLDETALAMGRRYFLKSGSRLVPAHVERIFHKIDLSNLREAHADTFDSNDVGAVRISTSRNLVFDRYRDNRSLGAFVLIDPETNATVAAGMIKEPNHAHGVHHQHSYVSELDRARRLGHRGLVVLLDGGLGVDGAERIAALEQKLFLAGVVAVQVGLDLDAALATASAGLVSLVVVAANARQRARDVLRGASVTWIETSLDDSAAASIVASCQKVQP